MVKAKDSPPFFRRGERGPLRVGELALLIDRKGRRYLVQLQAGQALHTHTGVVLHDEVLGQEEGVQLRSSKGATFLVLRPTLADYVLKMARGAQVIYPKDLGAILLAADIFPGARVLEAGLGSGALTLALLQAVGPEGHVTSYEIRSDFLAQGLRNIEQYWGGRPPHLTARLRDVYAGIEERDLDRVLFDLPEPWQAVEHAFAALRPGGLVLGYLPTTPQVHRFALALQEHGGFGLIEVREVLERPWEVSPQSLRPAHRMVAHTGFLVTARRLPKGEPTLGPAQSLVRVPEAVEGRGVRADGEHDERREDLTEEQSHGQDQDAPGAGEEAHLAHDAEPFGARTDVAHQERPSGGG